MRDGISALCYRAWKLKRAVGVIRMSSTEPGNTEAALALRRTAVLLPI